MPRRKRSVVAGLAAADAKMSGLLEEPSSEQNRHDERSKNPILDLLVRRIGKYDLLKKNELIAFFREVDDLYVTGINYLATHTHFMEGVLADNLAEVLGSLTGGRVIHNIPVTDEQKDPMWGNHLEFLSAGLEAIARREFKDKEQDYVADICRLRLVGSTIYNVLDSYRIFGSFYLELSDRYTCVYLDPRLDKATRQAELTKLSESMAKIANIMGTKEDDIPILARTIGPLVDRVTEIHQKIFNHHLRLLIKVATSLTTDGDQLLDNFQAGSFGLLRAVKDYVAPYNFIGYASSWIRQAVLGAMRAQSNNIRVPGNVLQEYSALEKMRHTLPGDVTLEELAKHAKQDPKKVQRIYDLVQIAHTYSIDKEISSQDADGVVTTLRDIIPDTQEPLDEREDIRNKMRVRAFLDMLGERERWVIALYFGLLDYLPNTITTKYGESCKEDRVRIESLKRESLRQLLITASLRLHRTGVSEGAVRH